MQSIIAEKGVDYCQLSKKDAISVSNDWVKVFFSETKNKTGKYQPAKFKWESYWSGIEPCQDGACAHSSYKGNEIEAFYITDESGKFCVECSPQSWPSFIGCGIDLYIFPKSLMWSMAFTHEGTCHYAIKKT